jgi:hypothetical protein
MVQVGESSSDAFFDSKVVLVRLGIRGNERLRFGLSMHGTYRHSSLSTLLG